MTAWDHWQSDDAKRDQYFYVGFALLASGINDFAVGRDLHLSRKLNWAASAYYYSMIHAGRLALFLVYGDFPTGHAPLAHVFANNRPMGSFWFTEFGRNLWPPVARSDASDYRREQLVARYAELGMDREKTSRMFKGWAEILRQSKKLREDSNYESLLIAHEHNHVIVTQAFQDLCAVLESCAKRILNDAARLFRAVIDSSPRGNHWLAFLNHSTAPRDP
jgi:uncharacterized protein (UPF0332 family)